jgi:type III secretory pathway lipoprotein EscJ
MQGVTQVCCSEVKTVAPDGVLSKLTSLVVPRVTVAHPERANAATPQTISFFISSSPNYATYKRPPAHEQAKTLAANGGESN